MYAKLNNGVIEKYPYTIGDLWKDNPNTSFPAHISNEILDMFGLVRVVITGSPDIDYTKNKVEGTPAFVPDRSRWEQTWIISDATAEEIAQRKAELNEQATQDRLQAYREEADPLFFKWQRGEASQQEWMDKVAEIKQRFPKID